MKTDLTDEQIQQYQQDGVLFYPGLLDADQVRELKAAVLETVASMGRQKIVGGNTDLVEGRDAYYDRVFTQRLNLWQINETVKRYMLAPELGRMLCRLEDQPGFRMGHDQALIKEPYGNPTAWHIDNPYWSFFSRHAVSIWIALEEATHYNGCMCFVPGSHRLARFDNVGIGANQADLFRVYPAMMETDPVCFPMKPGDCSFHNGLTAHGAGANMTRGRRIAMACAYMPEGSTFNGQQNVMPRDYFESLRVGDVLANDDLNPLVYAAGS